LRKQKETSLELKPVCAPQFIPLAKKMGVDLRFQRGCLAGPVIAVFCLTEMCILAVFAAEGGQCG